MCANVYLISIFFRYFLCLLISFIYCNEHASLKYRMYECFFLIVKYFIYFIHSSHFFLQLILKLTSTLAARVASLLFVLEIFTESINMHSWINMLMHYHVIALTIYCIVIITALTIFSAICECMK